MRPINVNGANDGNMRPKDIPRSHAASPTSPAAPLRDHDLSVTPPDYEEREPLLPQVRIAGFKLTSILVVVVLVGGAFFGLRAFINFSTDEVTRSKTEFHDAMRR